MKTLLLAGTALAATIAVPAVAQDTASSTAGQPDEQAIVVTGSRAAPRSALDTVSPVDVLSNQALSQQGTTEIAQALANIAPSIDFPRSAVVDGTDSIRPATLRGLSPDQTLVLVNGVRAHASALVNVNGSVGRGSSAVDLNTVPSVAIGQIEVLRDGASAQYGSDAIAGVINLRLREARSGGGASVSYGEYLSHVQTARDDRHVSDGDTTTLNGWVGLPLGAEGFLTISGEFLDRNPTNRSDIDPRVQPPRVRARFGDPEVDQYTGFVNAGIPLAADGWQLYGWTGYQYRDSTSAAFNRPSNNVNNVPAIYPDGFLPKIDVRSHDLNSAVGLRGDVSDWNVDLNISYGRNRLDFRTQDSLNATYGAQSQTDFYDGALIYDQWVTGLDVTREVPVGSGSLNVAWGAEYRREGYRIIAGEPASYNRGPLGGNTALAGGAQGFIGFQPANELEVHRSNVSGYLDLEYKPVEQFTVGVAGRAEHYSDFGWTANGKLSARYDFSQQFALRGAVSTGFRAPSLQQSYFTSTASVIQDGNVLETGTYPATSAIASALGALPLEPEKSTNLSFGGVFRSGHFSLTVDAYQITIRDQIGLSENIAATFSPQVAALLAPFGVQAARFYINGIKTRTRGLDIVANYRIPTASAGRFDLSLAANLNDVDVLRVPTNTAAGLDPAPLLFARSRILTYEEGTPETKIVGSVDWNLGRAGATLRGTYYDSVLQPGSTEASDLRTGQKFVVDLEARYQVLNGVRLAVGANNLFDVYPDAVPAALNSTGVTAFPFYSPFGFNGRFVYGRLSLEF
ncbi:TonB-dependent receptor [Sphingosinicella ginsenosidimutans]|uniref:TonB-dependent receptor n=1 Tax=Allosphingosinicella ginsenosidimutans TaxID=1176539 RepID=A0A5C6TV11_9SPHN|nr:TonB-dependent receptor [Sphingosinicella ginsenosidimutans]TXC64293.1 TonB-dependent receptor [Sphingosinicella ginsenosidimutans]